MLKHPDISTVIDIMSKKLHNCTTQQLELLNYICTHYEFFALVTFETYLIVTRWNGLFFRLVVPLPIAGVFSLFMNKVIIVLVNN